MGKKNKKQKAAAAAAAGVAQTATQVEAVILAGQCADICPSVLLTVGRHRLLFNAGCAIGRHAGEHRVRLAKISHIFLGEANTECASTHPADYTNCRSSGITVDRAEL
jgi:hypothetical protein